MLAEIRQSYALEWMETRQLLQRGLNASYLAAGKRDRYIARVYGAPWRPTESVAYELELLRLEGKGLSVSLPVPTRDGDLMRLVAAPEGVRQLVLFTFADGSPLSWEDLDQCRLAGRSAAQLHETAGDFTSRHARFRLDLDHLIDAQLDALRPFLEQRGAEWRALERFAEVLRRRATIATEAGLDWGVCHSELVAKNLHFARGLLTMFDFDLAAPGWRAYDLAAVWWVSAGQRQTPVWDAFVSGYVELRGLDAADMEPVPVFHAVRRLRSLGTVAASAPALGFFRLAPEQLAPELRFFGEWEGEQSGRRLGVGR